MENKTLLELFWESVKLPIRLFILAVYGFIVTQVLLLVSQQFGVEISGDLKVQIDTYGTTLATAILAVIDNWIHRIAKQKAETLSKSGVAVSKFWVRGIARI